MLSMSKMKSDCRPPLAKSPMRLRPRPVVRSSTTSTSIQTPPGSLARSQKPNRSWAINNLELQPDYRTISWELRALANDVRTELGKEESENAGVVLPSSATATSLFERGRFYEEYAARRNEWLKRKKGQFPDEKNGYNLGVTVEFVKRSSSRKLGSLRKSVSAAYSVETPRYMLRSMSKENKKPPLPLKWNKALPGEETKLATRRVQRNWPLD